MPKLGHLRKQIRYTQKISKCGAGEEWTDCVRNEVVIQRQRGGEYPTCNNKKES